MPVSTTMPSLLGQIAPVTLLSACATILIFVVLTVGLREHSPAIAGFSFDHTHLLNVHIALMCVGALTCLNAVAFVKAGRWHGLFNTCALVVLILGAVAAYYYDGGTSEREHLYSSHALMGFVTLVLLILQWIGGVVSFVFWRSKAACWFERHKMAGIIIVLGLLGAVCSGLMNFERFLDSSVYPYDGFGFRYSFLYLGINVTALLFMLIAGFVFYIVLDRISPAVAYEHEFLLIQSLDESTESLLVQAIPEGTQGTPNSVN